MKCQACGKRAATVHYTELSGSAASEIHLCEECAQAKGLFKVAGGQLKFKVGDFLAGMAEVAGGEDTADQLACPDCGKTYAEFKETGRLGCGACYVTFSAQLKPLLRRIHGATAHVGKRPNGDHAAPQAQRSEVRELRDELRRALEREDFERCAELRDKIKLAQRKERGA
jgi:protein arginine kinase activator